MKKIILAAALVLLPSGSAYAATANGTANATVVAPISVAHNSGAALNFGTFTADTGGTVTVTAGGSGSVSDGTNSMAFTTTPSAATGTLSSGTATFTVGGTLTVGSGQAANAYTGSYVATVNYQ